MKLFLILPIFFYSFFVNAQEASDPKAIELADKVMKALGGQKNYDKTRHITWNFFGVRRLTWDKWTGNVRIDNLRDNTVSLINVNTDTGRIFRNGAEVTQPDSVSKYVKRAKGAWINDSYWLVMPYKLKDNGVTLKYIGTEQTLEKKDAEVVQLTFKNVGNTPDNKYKVYIDPITNLVVQWSYFPKFTDEKPQFSLPWKNYEKYGKILLSGDRGERKLTEIKVFEKLPDTVYQSFDKPSL
jgi:hypothetical protein